LYDMAKPFPQKGTPLAPNGTTEQPFTVSLGKWALIEKGDETLYLWGLIEYRDVFDLPPEI